MLGPNSLMLVYMDPLGEGELPMRCDQVTLVADAVLKGGSQAEA